MKLCKKCYKAPALEGVDYCAGPDCYEGAPLVTPPATVDDPVRIIPLDELLAERWGIPMHEIPYQAIAQLGVDASDKVMQRGADVVAMDGCSLHNIEFPEGDVCPACAPMYEAAQDHSNVTGHLTQRTPAGVICKGCEWSAVVGKIDDTPPPSACVQCGLPAWRGRLRCEAHHLEFAERAAAEAERLERVQRKLQPLPKPAAVRPDGSKKPGTRGKVQPEVLARVRDMLEECTPTSMIQQVLSDEHKVDKRTVRTWITRVRKAISGETKKEGLDAQLYRKGQFVAFLERVAFESLSKGKYSQAVRAAHEIGLAYGLLSQKIELSGANGGPIETQEKLDKGLLDHLAKFIPGGDGSGGTPPPATPAT